jgi:hypothetical protein
VSAPIIAYIFGGLFLLLGLGGIYGAWSWRRRGQESLHWPTVQGKIVASQITTDVSRDSDGDESTVHGADIRYRYSVDGVAHESKTVQWAGDFKSSGTSWQGKRVAKYPVGAGVTVYYDPRNPAVAVLEPASRSGSVLTLLMALAFTVAGGGFILLTWYRD